LESETQQTNICNSLASFCYPIALYLTFYRTLSTKAQFNFFWRGLMADLRNWFICVLPRGHSYLWKKLLYFHIVDLHIRIYLY